MWMPRSRRMAIRDPRPHENTLVCARAIMPAYPSLDKLEDTPLVDALMRTQTVSLLDLPELYVYVAHGANTWDEGHMENMWRLAAERFALQAYDDALMRLSRSYPIKEYTQALESAARAAGASA
jgi:hypothetical protein